ncbi:MAG: methyltransferase domain-containing protein [Actinobacteria bacterium]|uniref:Unannotated protein n=1 Tax=freshwater metagenome TaxID=449393 RepID=A0A6J7IB94_9ZZZZ|nr:methyltransferase domain-containing protein [Actinomycetota bacterium]
MNVVHRRYCRSARWRHHLDDLLPWALEDVSLGPDSRVIELGSGPGQTTDWLRGRVGHLTAVERDEHDAADLAARRADVQVVHADARDVPLPSGSFDAVLCFTMLHHLPSVAAQDQLMVEAARLLEAGGVFAGSDSRWGPLFALAHVRDTMTLVVPGQLPARLVAAGLQDPVVEWRRDALRFRAVRP